MLWRVSMALCQRPPPCLNSYVLSPHTQRVGLGAEAHVLASRHPGSTDRWVGPLPPGCDAARMPARVPPRKSVRGCSRTWRHRQLCASQGGASVRGPRAGPVCCRLRGSGTASASCRILCRPCWGRLRSSVRSVVRRFVLSHVMPPLMAVTFLWRCHPVLCLVPREGYRACFRALRPPCRQSVLCPLGDRRRLVCVAGCRCSEWLTVGRRLPSAP